MTVPERLVVVFRVTTRCPLACGFCAYDRTLDIPRGAAESRVAEALAVVLSAERARRPVHVSFLGGEPLLWEPLESVARRYREEDLSLGVTTSGVTLEREDSRELLLRYFDELTVSVDGIGDAHDALRGWPGGFARLERALRWLSAAKARRGAPLLLRVNTVLMAGNVRQFPELCRVLASWGVEQVTFNRLGGRDRPEFYARHRLTVADVEWLAELLPGLRRELAPRGLRIVGSDDYVARLTDAESGRAARVDDCQPGRDFLFVDERGQVAPCHFTLDDYGVPLTAPAATLETGFRRLQLCQRAAACDDCQSTRVFHKFGAEHGA